MTSDLGLNFVRLLFHLRRQDLVSFVSEHDRLSLEAKSSNDYSAVTKHYYSLMSTVIDQYFSGNFHFAPPERRGQSREMAMKALHCRIGQLLNLSEESRCLDVGCGVGRLIMDLAGTGARITGITIAPNEAEIGNARLRLNGLDSRCGLMVGDCHRIPLPDASFDCVYAVYALKYFTDVHPIFSEIARVLRPGGRLLIYDLLKTTDYDENDTKQRAVVEGLEYACGMPALHTRQQLINTGNEFGLRLESGNDLAVEMGRPFFACFTDSPLLMWLMRSRTAKALIALGQFMRILPRGFDQFNEKFLSGTVNKIVDGGTMGILSGSELLLFEKTD